MMDDNNTRPISGDGQRTNLLGTTDQREFNTEAAYARFNDVAKGRPAQGDKPLRDASRED